MDTTKMKGKTKLGSIIAALAILAPVVLPMLGVDDGELCKAIQVILGAIGTGLFGVGAADKMNRAKPDSGMGPHDG